MNISEIQNIGFKSQMLDKRIEEIKSKAPISPLQNEIAPIGSFKQFLYQLNQPTLYAAEFSINKMLLSNNVKLLIDSNSPAKTPVACICITTKEDINPAVAEILNSILYDESLKINEKNNSSSTTINLNQNFISCNVDANEADFARLFDSLCNAISSPNLSEENFNKIKNEIISKKKTEEKTPTQQAMQPFYPSRKLSIEDLSKVTLKDVENAHTKIMTNSAITVSMSATNEFFKENKVKIIEILEKTLPKAQVETIQRAKDICQLDKDYRIEGKTTSDHSVVEKFYVLDLDSSVENEVKAEILTKLLKNRIEKKLSPKGNCEIVVTRSLFAKDGYLEIYLSSKNKQISALDMEKYMNDSIQSFYSEPILKEELDIAKKQAVEELKLLYSNSNIRSLSLLENYSDGIISIKSINNVLNSFGEKEINELIKSEFSKFSSTCILS